MDTLTIQKKLTNRYFFWPRFTSYRQSAADPGADSIQPYELGDDSKAN